MHRIRIARADDIGFGPTDLRKLFRLRYQVFSQKLGWSVTHERGEERDDYDRLDPYYMLASSPDGSLGCWRLLPTAGPYMLRDTFAELLRGESAPVASDVWELSRFAVTSATQRCHGQIQLSPLTIDMIGRLIGFAETHGVREYVTVTSVAVERLMMRAGIPMSRFGDGRSIRIGRVESVACHIPVDRRFREAVCRAKRHLQEDLALTA